ncbi:aminomethyltransferase folate-binding domain-containing protein [Phanerochaete sordida]|uniref:Aminomethyltransferase folate-binding domain-containing protein n=1 Tax=Phanerochaete sordida TaxID=48140 RepID=A0A9P3L771_9APHY|nr:aminomethyltransferase folate-binding domain-containing protein [Phanerochaete sordida]
MLRPSVHALLRHTPTLAPVPHRAVLAVTGSQASEFLNGIVASTVPPPGAHFFTAFLQAQGRVLHDAFVHAHTSPEGRTGFLVEYDARASEAPPLLAMLKRYVLRARVKLRDVSDEYDVWAAWGSDREKAWESTRQWGYSRSGAVEPVWNEEAPWGSVSGPLHDRRAVGMGARVLSRKGDRPQGFSDYDVATSDDYTRHRILHGVPEGNIDITPDQAFPMDSNLDFMGALDFRKGCYVGQELTVRVYHTGLVRKRIYPVLLGAEGSAAPSLPAGTDIRVRAIASSPDGARKPRPRGTGKLLSSIDGVGLALLRLEQASAVEKGESEFYVDATADDGSSISVPVSSWRPEWWPEFRSESEQ